MKKELEHQLYAISPVFFKDAISCENGEKNEMNTCMYWGCECGDGWFEPLKKMAFRFHILNEYAQRDNIQIYASQIKEKYGTLSVYFECEKCKAEENIESDVLKKYNQFANIIIEEAIKDCENICEICGGGDVKFNPIIQTHGWISFICQDCAIKNNQFIQEKKEINQFDGPFNFLSLAHQTNFKFSYKGMLYTTFAGAYYAQLRPQFAKIFADFINPYQVFRFVNEIMTPEEKKDIIAIENMRDIYQYKFSIPEWNFQLKKTKNFHLIFGNKFHDNFWGQCYCDKCKSIKGENILGNILMDIRNKYL